MTTQVPLASAQPPLLDLGLKSGRVLVLADGDCSYSARLAQARPELRVVASTYDGRHRVPEDCAAAVAALHCELDALGALPRHGDESWDRVVINFPKPIGRQHVARARSLLRGMLLQVARVLAVDGQCWLTLEAGGASGQTGGGPGGGDWDAADAGADAELVLVSQTPARVREVYVPKGAKTDGVLHVFAPAVASPVAEQARQLQRDVSLVARHGNLEELAQELEALCAPVEVSLELLDRYPLDGGTEQWTVRLSLTAPRCALSRRKAHLLCGVVERGERAELPPLLPEAVGEERRAGWTVWCHKLEPSIEDFLALLARPVERPEDARLIWANATWKHASAFVNHFDDAVLNKRDVGRLLQGSSHVPRTFVLPEQKQEWDESRGSVSHWIAKPSRLGRGEGIVVFADEDRPADLASGVVSQYITPPFRIDGRKVDLRIYVLLRSLGPQVEAYVHPGGYVRFAALEYSLVDLLPRRHLTNNSVNRAARVAPPPLASGPEVTPGDNWPLSELWRHVDKEAVWPRICALLASCLDGLAASLVPRAGRGSTEAERCFGLLGFDVLLDAELRPWLCEVNANPTLEAGRPIDRAVDVEMFGDLLTLLETSSAASTRWERLATAVERHVIPRIHENAGQTCVD